MKHLLSIVVLSALGLSKLMAGAYETLEFGDTREQVTKKLKSCERIECTVPDTLLGRVGLNGSFAVKKQLSGLTFSLFFNWDEDGHLKEINLRSEAIDSSEHSSAVAQAFSETALLLTEIHGKPVMANTMPAEEDFDSDIILNSHLWLKESSSVLLGLAKKEGKYHIAVTFLNKRITPVAK